MKKEIHLSQNPEHVRKEREQLVKQLLATIPREDANRGGLIETPKRVAKMYNEIFEGYEQEDQLDLIFSKVFGTDNDEMVIVKDINYWSHCEHHMVPFFGKVHIGYIPSGKVLGLSKFARLVNVYSRRLQIQEQLTFQIADEIEKRLNPKGLAVVVEGVHMCMVMRGVKSIDSSTITSSMRGIFREKPEARQEFLKLISK